jgi:hypothetical protein
MSPTSVPLAVVGDQNLPPHQKSIPSDPINDAVVRKVSDLWIEDLKLVRN